MVLSNAERQARYRRRLKQKASDPVSAAREAADGAVAALWEFYNRPVDGRLAWGDIDGIESQEQWRAHLTGSRLLDAARSWVSDGQEMALERGMTETEFAALATVVAIDEAIQLKS